MSWQSDVYGRWSGSKKYKRKRPPPAIRKQLDCEQYCCYCGVAFGEYTTWHGRLQMTKRTYEHFVPFTMDPTQPDDNWFAACQICNNLKSNLVFDTFLEAKAYVLKHRWQ